MKAMLVISDPELKIVVKEILASHGIQVAAEADSIGDLLRKMGEQKVDIVILDSDVEEGLHQKIAMLRERDEALPVLILSGKEKPDIKDCPYVLKTVLPEALPVVIHNVVISNKKYLALLQEVERLNRQLAARKAISIAKALLMEQQGLGEEEAHKLIQKMSMEKGSPLKKVAEDIIDQLTNRKLNRAEIKLAKKDPAFSGHKPD